MAPSATQYRNEARRLQYAYIHSINDKTICTYMYVVHDFTYDTYVVHVVAQINE